MSYVCAWGKIKVNYMVVYMEDALRIGIIASVCYLWGFGGGFLRVMSMACGTSLFNQIRMITEHGGQDLENAHNQSTFYESGIFLRLA